MADRPWRGVVRVEEYVGKFAPWRVELVADGYGTIAWCRSGSLADAIADLLNREDAPAGCGCRDDLLRYIAGHEALLASGLEHPVNRAAVEGLVGILQAVAAKLPAAPPEVSHEYHEAIRQIENLESLLAAAERERDDARRGWYESSEEWKQDVRRIAYRHRQQWGRELWLACQLEAMRRLWCDALIQAAQAIALREENP